MDTELSDFGEANGTNWQVCPTCHGQGQIHDLAPSVILSVVIPAFQEGTGLEHNLKVIHSTMSQIGSPFEMVVVDDGSTDKTWQVLEALHTELPELAALRFSRNFGKESAIAAGIEYARGAACIIMDADLQHPPTLIPEMVRLWQQEKWDIVQGVKITRGRESRVYHLAAMLFYGIFNRLTRLDLDNASDFKLLDRRVLASWRRLRETNTFFRGLVPWLGFRHTQIPFHVSERVGGKTSWSFSGLVRLALVGITAFSSVPLQIVTALGIFVLASSVIFALYEITRWFMGSSYPGFPTVILLLLGIGGTLMVSLGIIGIYIARIYEEVKGRPRYILMDTLESASAFKHNAHSSPSNSNER